MLKIQHLNQEKVVIYKQYVSLEFALGFKYIPE